MPKYTFEYMNAKNFEDRQTSKKHYEMVQDAGAAAGEYAEIMHSNGVSVWVRIVEVNDAQSHS